MFQSFFYIIIIHPDKYLKLGDRLTKAKKYLVVSQEEHGELCFVANDGSFQFVNKHECIFAGFQKEQIIETISPDVISEINRRLENLEKLISNKTIEISDKIAKEHLKSIEQLGKKGTK